MCGETCKFEIQNTIQSYKSEYIDSDKIFDYIISC